MLYDLVYGHKWSEQLPVNQRYLLLAAYLAGANPKQTDGQVFGYQKKGRRKKRRLGEDNASVMESETSSTIIIPKNSFELERVWGIFVQIALKGDKDTDQSDHGGAYFSGKETTGQAKGSGKNQKNIAVAIMDTVERELGNAYLFSSVLRTL